METQIQDFPLFWRWNSPAHDQFPEEVLSKLFPLSSQTAKSLEERLKAYLDPWSLKKSPFHSVENIQAVDCESRPLESLNIPGDTDVVIIWDALTALKIKWSILEKHWDTFCYPASDDALIAPLSGEWLLAYWHFELFEFGRFKDVPISLPDSM